MQTSAQGIAALELEEGVVLRAYRDCVGVWTIGAGLTAASGVVVPKAGMVITSDEATALLQRALRANYEPAVEVAMSRIDGGSDVVRPQQHEFDAGISFHWNTGAIKAASWVKLWKAKAGRNPVIDALLKWNKGGGKVLPSLTARRQREAAMLMDGGYRSAPNSVPQLDIYARWGIVLTDSERAAAMQGFNALGFRVALGHPPAILKMDVIKFQADHGLTADGIIGRATLTTLQRRLDAKAKTKAPLLAAVAAVPAATAGVTDQIATVPHAGDASLLGLAVWAMSLAWRYRDVVAATINPTLPRLAAILRSF